MEFQGIRKICKFILVGWFICEWIVKLPEIWEFEVLTSWLNLYGRKKLKPTYVVISSLLYGIYHLVI